MNAFLAFPERLHWNAQDIADAVPLRLFEMYDFDPADSMPSANRGHAPRAGRDRYAPAGTEQPLFRIRG